MTPVPTVFFYISGHGFGHAVRQIAIIGALFERTAGSVQVAVRTSVPPWLFERTLRGPYRVLPGETDTGVVQIDALRLDAEATVTRARSFYEALPARVDTEAALLAANGARLVIGDAPPLACAAAAAAGLPSIVCANFTWDWIYEAYLGPGGSPPGLLSTIRDAYSQAAGGWRLPMHGGFETVPSTIDVPLVARHARRDRSRCEVRRMLGLPPDRPLALATFGGYGAGNLPLDRLDCVPEWNIVLTTAERRPPLHVPGVLVVPEELLYASGLQYQDLVAAVDVAVTKPGYGIISDCAANDTAVLYTSRGRFPEYEVIVSALPRLVRSRFIDQEDLLQGRWREGLGALHDSAPVPAAPRTDGAEVVAAMIAEAAAAT